MFFFFSSRRRHTRWPRDWSSDVCSSDLNPLDAPRIDNNYLSTERDRAAARAGIRMARRVLDQSAYAPFRGEEDHPGPDMPSDDEMDDTLSITCEVYLASSVNLMLCRGTQVAEV